MSEVCERAVTHSIGRFWIKIARYPAYKVEIESSTPLQPPFCTIRTSSWRIWMKNVYRLLCCATCLKLSTASKHYNLLSKLHLLGVSASALAWFKSYLSLRKQVVRIGSDLSNPFHWQWVWPRGPFSVQFCSHCTSTTFSLYRRSAKPWAVCRRHQAAFGPSPVWHQSCHFWLQWWSSRDRKVVFNKLLLINPNKTKLLVVSVPQLTRNVSLPPVVLLGTNIKLFPVERLWSLDRLCRNFRRSYI